ncbi:zinc finger protein 892 [Toxorhynchites rutilus septentrionalis]|uniref:zinc finger protein 892 n=1 Tax=Toxorhynchites rutilus septentrionalis TaxID=329112 RepID=UPI0024786D7F|nr:zinc finger protein 892 [Toxorhynchites rutilus septentrionalis]
MNNHFLTPHLDFNADITADTIASAPLESNPLDETTVVVLSPQPSTFANIDNASANPKIIYLDRVCRTCMVDKEKDQLKNLFEFCLAGTIMACVNISIEESDGLPCHICMDCLQEVERIINFRQQCERSDATIRNLIEKSVVINQDRQTKYEVLNVVLTDANGNTETSAVVVPIEELRFQLINGRSPNAEGSAGLVNIPVVELNNSADHPSFPQAQPSGPIEITIPTGGLDLSFPASTDMLISDNNIRADQNSVDEQSIAVNPNELLNETVTTIAPNDLLSDEKAEEELNALKNLKQELSEFIGSNCADLTKDQDLDDNDDDEMIHVDYLKDALTEEYIQTMEKQLAPSVTRIDESLQDRLEQENLHSLINDEDRIQLNAAQYQQQQQQGLEGSDGIHQTVGNDALSSDGDGYGDYDERYCKICDIGFEDNKQYKRHAKKHSEKRFECNFCQRKFAEQSLLRNHMLRHTGEKIHTCNVCSARFFEKNMLNVHMRRHSNERPYSCETCGKRFTTKSLLNTHNKIHLGEKSHICTVCGKGFTLSWQLKAHTRIHTNEKPYECPYCQKRFNQNGNLMIHIRIHTGERPFKCTLCDKAYPSQGELSGHMRQHTGEKKVKKIACTVCEKAFAGNGDLKIHMRTHTKEKPYSCQLCGKSFMLHVHLTVHMRSHTGEKPFACSICEKAFATNYQLKNHTYVHTGEKNYSCDVCNRRFSSSANRNTHRKTHDRKIS